MDSLPFLPCTEKNRSYVVSSFTELKAYELLSKASMQFVDYNKRQMSRVYPKGTRMDSSNYMPQMFWNAGCQMVALNFQTMDLPMQQNMALFEFNGQSGYLLKHEFMRRLDKQFNPFSVDRIDVVVATTLSITIISGQFLSERSVRTYVEVELFGLPGDPKRRYRTKLSPTANSINPVWKEEPFIFEKILMPELASLRIAVMEEGSKFLGHRIIPINALHSGYHHLCLRSESNMALTMPALFVFLEMKDYIPDTWADLTVALANPIKYFNAQDKKSVKLKGVTGSLPEKLFSGTPVASQSNGAPVSAGNGSTAPGTKATGEEATKEVTEPQTASLEELRELKGVVKLQRRHEKELRELERRGARRWEELLQRGAAQLAELQTQAAGCKLRPGKGSRKKRTLPCEETVVAPSEPHDRADPRVQELKDRLEQELQQQGEEQYRSVLKRKEQHVTEQIAKMMELAREKQAAELKTFKETSETDTKEMKKKLEAKRLERIQAMTKVTTDKVAQERLKREINNSHIQEVVQAVKQMTETLERHQEKLEERQTACLEQIQAMEKQFQEKALAEYEAKMKGLEAEVKESVRAYFKDCFPTEAEDKPERSCEASEESCPQEPLVSKADTQESRL